MAATGLTRARLALHPSLSGPQEARLKELVRRRLAGEPLQYLEGTVSFGPVEVAIDPRGLIPRPETEQMWEMAVQAMDETRPGSVLVDLGTGSGVLALALKRSFPQARVFGVDADPGALALARENGERTGLDVIWLLGDLFSPLPDHLRGRVTLVVSNPPYLSEEEWGALPAEITEHEPRQALVAGPRGTEVLARIAATTGDWLAAGGLVICEIGETQAEAVLQLFAPLQARVLPDLAGRPRFVVGGRQ